MCMCVFHCGIASTSQVLFVSLIFVFFFASACVSLTWSFEHSYTLNGVTLFVQLLCVMDWFKDFMLSFDNVGIVIVPILQMRY